MMAPVLIFIQDNFSLKKFENLRKIVSGAKLWVYSHFWGVFADAL